MSVKKQAKLLVQSILAGDNLTAEQLLTKLILEAEQQRQSQAAAQAGVQDEPTAEPTDQVPEEQGQDVPPEQGQGQQEELSQEEGQVQAEEGQGQSQEGQEGGEEFDAPEQPSDQQVNQLVDDQLQIACQINQSIVEDLLNIVAELKTKFQNMDLDKHSRQYFEIKISLQYYSQKLQKLQSKTNISVNQDQVKEQLDDITTALKQLEGTISGGQSQQDQQIKSLDQVKASTGLEQQEPVEQEQGQQVQQQGEGDQPEQTEQEQQPESDQGQVQEVQEEEFK